MRKVHSDIQWTIQTLNLQNTWTWSKLVNKSSSSSDFFSLTPQTDAFPGVSSKHVAAHPSNTHPRRRRAKKKQQIQKTKNVMKTKTETKRRLLLIPTSETALLVQLSAALQNCPYWATTRSQQQQQLTNPSNPKLEDWLDCSARSLGGGLLFRLKHEKRWESGSCLEALNQRVDVSVPGQTAKHAQVHAQHSELGPHWILARNWVLWSQLACLLGTDRSWSNPLALWMPHPAPTTAVASLAMAMAIAWRTSLARACHPLLHNSLTFHWYIIMYLYIERER